jgi:hypothetical protein
LKIGQKYILFFQIPKSPLENYKNDLSKISKSSLRITNGKVYREYFDKEFKNLKEILLTIEDFVRINDIQNFYKRNYMGKELKNEK